MNKKIISIVVVIIVIILGVWSFQDKTTGPKEVIKIGVVAPMTGSAAVFGTAFVKGIEMAVADVSKENTRFMYEIIVEDDQSTPAKSASAASKLINVDKVQAILSSTGATGNSIKSQAEVAKIIHVSNSKDPSIGNVSYNFTNLMLPEDEVIMWVKKAREEGNNTVAVFTQNHAGAVMITKAFLPEAEKQGLRVVYNESFLGDNRDFKTIIAKAKESKADIYFLVAYPPSLDILAKELMDSGAKNIGLIATVNNSTNVNLYNGLWYTDSTLTDRDFLRRFESLNPGIKFSMTTAPYGYDSFNMLVQSFEKGGDANANLKAITEYDGKVGKVTKDANSQNFRSAASIWTMVNGVPEMVR
jgi:ABC-type branched-subunit amino acid transport system substrate-binding protein